MLPTGLGTPSPSARSRPDVGWTQSWEPLLPTVLKVHVLREDRAQDGQSFPQRSNGLLDRALGPAAPEVDRERVAPKPRHAPNHHIDPVPVKIGSTHGERSGLGEGGDRLALERVQQLSDGLSAVRISRGELRWGQPSPGTKFPVVDSAKSTHGESMQHVRRKPGKVGDLRSFVFLEHRLQTLPGGQRRPIGGPRSEVDFKMYVRKGSVARPSAGARSAPGGIEDRVWPDQAGRREGDRRRRGWRHVRRRSAVVRGLGGGCPGPLRAEGSMGIQHSRGRP